MYTRHADIRCQQRGISADVVDTLLAYGDRQRHQGADVYFLTQRSRRRLAGALGPQYRHLERRLNCYVVVSDDGAIITVGHRYRRLKF